MIEKNIPKKSPFDVYEENKMQMNMLLENVDIDRKEVNLVLHIIKRD
jgi:hypothetical protein